LTVKVAIEETPPTERTFNRREPRELLSELMEGGINGELGEFGHDRE
jgi:hypothetical protein